MLANSHDYLLHVAARLSALHDRVSTAKAALARAKARGGERDPFRAAAEAAARLSAAEERSNFVPAFAASPAPAGATGLPPPSPGGAGVSVSAPPSPVPFSGFATQAPAQATPAFPSFGGGGLAATPAPAFGAQSPAPPAFAAAPGGFGSTPPPISTGHPFSSQSASGAFGAVSPVASAAGFGGNVFGGAFGTPQANANASAGKRTGGASTGGRPRARGR
jgi:hypothetical protein